LGFFIGVALISYPYLMSKYNSSANLLDAIIKAVKSWVKTGSFEFINQLPTDAFVQDVYDKASEKTDILDSNIKNENTRKIFILFPELELYQKWLLEQQDYYIEYQYDIFTIWKKILSKIIDIISNPASYAASNMNDLLNLQIQLLDIFEFKKDISTSTNPNSEISIIVKDIARRNREFNTNLVKWIKNNRGETNTRGCLTLNDFEVNDWVAPSNLMTLR
jgi:polyhydroxyalkanoate synthesis regulator phasin